jgi:hypothetical protein
MATADQVIELIHDAFTAGEYPGDPWLQGSSEGCEPAEEVGPFVGRTRWQDLDPAMLDGHYSALSFFSEAGFRFFLPAFLVADLRGQLQTADPEGHLTRGFSDRSVRLQAGGKAFERRFGASQLVNPRRYGAMRMGDYARYRLSVFTREEAGAIVAYLEYKRDLDDGLRGEDIERALATFWRARTEHAPIGADLRQHLADEQEYVEAIRRGRNERA